MPDLHIPIALLCICEPELPDEDGEVSHGEVGATRPPAVHTRAIARNTVRYETAGPAAVAARGDQGGEGEGEGAADLPGGVHESGGGTGVLAVSGLDGTGVLAVGTGGDRSGDRRDQQAHPCGHHDPRPRSPST